MRISTEPRQAKTQWTAGSWIGQSRFGLSWLIVVTCLCLWTGLAEDLTHVQSSEVAEVGGVIDSAVEDVVLKSVLNLDRLFDSDDFQEEDPGRMTWTKDGRGFYSLEKPRTGSTGRDLVRYDIESGVQQVLVPAHAFIPPGESQPLSLDDFEFSQDESRILIYTNSRRVWRLKTRGDYWVLDITSRELKKLGGDAAPSTLMFAQFSPDGRHVAFVHNNNIFVQDLRTLEVTGLTSDGSEEVINGTFDWVYEEELGLHRGYEWSPDGKAIAYWQIDTSDVRRFYLVNNTEGLYASITPIPYPKTGEKNSAARIGVVFVDGGDTRWLNIPGDPRNHYLAKMAWVPDTMDLWIQQFNRLQNVNRVWLARHMGVDLYNIWEETDAAWVENRNPARWIRQGTETLWLSERDGWRHVYRQSLNDSEPRRITHGNFDVLDIESIDETGGWLYFSASPDKPTQRYLYRIPLDGGTPERLSPSDQPGTHTYRIVPGARWALHTYSQFHKPPVSQWVQLPDHSTLRVWRDNEKLIKNVSALKQPSTEFFRIDIPASSGLSGADVRTGTSSTDLADTVDTVPESETVALDGWCIRPPDFDATKKYPVIFHVYGEPAGQTVLDRWRGRTGLWHWMLAQQGYVVVSVDNRGTPAPRGRAWRKITYRQIGIITTADQAAAVRELTKQWDWMDTDRVGIWGWSGGGSMTLNAMFQYPDLYRAGMSIAPVPNQRFYDTIYQERYMGLPDDNSEGYRLGSPVTHAHQLKGDLLVIHGTGDDNCHYQGTEALINELIAHNKVFSMMAYPNRSHSISEGVGTSKHLFTLLTRFLHQHLPRENE